MKQNPLKEQPTPAGLGKILVAHLIPDAKNPRKDLKKGDPEFEKISKSVEKFGQLDPIIFNTRTRKVIGGHQRLKVLDSAGYTELYTVTLGAYTWAFAEADLKELSDKEESAANIALNKAKGDWAMDQLTANLQELKLEGLLDLTGFDDKEFDQMLRELHKDDEPQDSEPQISRAEELRKEWGTELGQMWQCGEHRVICGDCTDPAVVKRLMQGEKAEVLFTSPPYSDMRTYNGITDLTVNKLIGFIPAFKSYVKYQVINLGIQRKDGGVIQYWDNYIKAAKDAGYKLLSWNVWDKGRGGSVGAMSAMFPLEHEWIFVFGEKPEKLTPTIKNDTAGEKTRWRNMDKSGSYGGYKECTKNNFGVLGTVIASRMVNKNADHPAQFPLEVPSAYIEAMTAIEDVALDPFLGSGTTMIACENLGRKARGIEIDPGYVAVILQRYKDTFPDREIRLIADNSGA